MLSRLRWVEAILRDRQQVRTRFASERIGPRMYQYVNSSRLFFAARRVFPLRQFDAAAVPDGKRSNQNLPRNRRSTYGQGDLISTSHEATAPSGKGDHRSSGPRVIREDQGHGP